MELVSFLKVANSTKKQTKMMILATIVNVVLFEMGIFKQTDRDLTLC